MLEGRKKQKSGYKYEPEVLANRPPPPPPPIGKAEKLNLKLIYANGIPCNHKGCRQHTLHPCEACGRVGCKGEIYGNNNVL